MAKKQLDIRPAACATMLAFLVVYLGCSYDPAGPAPKATPPNATSTGSGAAAPGSDVVPGNASPIDKLMAELNNPAALLIVSGQQDGYLEPCGCSAEQIGGLIRRFDLVERLQNKNWPVSLIEMGGLIKEPNNARGGIEQAKIKFDYAVKALKLLKYDALALSTDDLKVGVAEAMGLFDNNLGEKTKIVVANVKPESVFEKLFRPSIVATAGPLKLGITSVIDPDLLQRLSDPEKDVSLKAIKAPEEVLPGVLTELEAKSDYQVLMVQGPPALAKRLGEAFPAFDVVVATSDTADPLSHEPEPLNGGKTMLISIGKKGKYVGVVGFHPKDAKPLQFHLVTLNRRFDGAGAPMKMLIEDEYRQTLKAAGVVENFERRPFVGGAPGATFVGADTCKDCHPNTFDKWKNKTKHPKAFDALLRDKKPNSAFDAECVTCHTTGFEFTSGWKSEKETPHLAGNQCENCHGPSSRHVAEPDNAEFRKFIHLDGQQLNNTRLCYNCHDEDNSRDFELSKFYGEIVHKALDKYDDPKVHKGIAPAPKAASTVNPGASK
jgi:Cytochrome c554 and c-prime